MRQERMVFEDVPGAPYLDVLALLSEKSERLVRLPFYNSLSQEDQEFEVARRVVRLGAEAAQNSASMPPTVPPQQAAKAALIEAAKKHAPGLLTRPDVPSGPFVPSVEGKSGRWIRRGRKIILLGV
jgi:hypothetical protein